MKYYCPCCGSLCYAQTPDKTFKNTVNLIATNEEKHTVVSFWCPECDSTHLADDYETINQNTLNLIATNEVK